MGYPGYFLVTADCIGWAKSQGIRVGPGRGSAAGSMVAYAMGITELDPIEHGLLFERFLNQSASMPDIDIDFDEAAVARSSTTSTNSTPRPGRSVATFGTIKAKQAVRTPRESSDIRSPWASGSPRRCHQP